MEIKMRLKPYDFKIRDGQLQVVMWELILYRIPLKNIIIIERLSIWENRVKFFQEFFKQKGMVPIGIAWDNRPSWYRVAITKNSGMHRKVYITPENYKTFIGELTKACPQLKQTGEWRWEASKIDVPPLPFRKGAKP